MTKLGVVANASSWKNRGKAVPAPPSDPDLIFEAPAAAGDYPAVMKRFAEAGVTTIAVDGGDGTLRDVLSAAYPAFGQMPAIALVPGGKTNVAAADVGGAPRGADLFERLLAAHRGRGSTAVAVRRPIAVSADGWTRLGFVFGLGAFERATRLVNERVHSRGFAQGLGVALGVAMSGFAALGRDGEAWRRGVPLSIAIDGGPERSHASFALLATSLRRLTLGLWPFWGQGAGAIDVTEVSAPPQRLMRTLATAGLGKPPSWAAEAGYLSVKADRVELGLTDPFIFDGDAFQPGPDGRVTLAAGPEIRFLRP